MNTDAKRNICIAKQTLLMSSGNGHAIKNHDYYEFMGSGGAVIGNIRTLNSYKFEIEDSPEESQTCYVEDDVYKKDIDLERMTMNKSCFDKYFIVVESNNPDGKEE